MHRRPSFLLTLAVFAVLFAAGCSKTTQQSTSGSGTAAPSRTAAVGSGSRLVALAPVGDVAHGKLIFKDKCEMCHGVNGVDGGVGPTLKNERKRKNLAQAIVWIKNPRTPMPKYYPADLDEKGVADVAA